MIMNGYPYPFCGHVHGNQEHLKAFLVAGIEVE
jgi:hypothetical protein